RSCLLLLRRDLRPRPCVTQHPGAQGAAAQALDAQQLQYRQYFPRGSAMIQRISDMDAQAGLVQVVCRGVNRYIDELSDLGLKSSCHPGVRRIVSVGFEEVGKTARRLP